MFGRTTSTQPMSFQTIFMTIIFMVLERFILYILPILPQYYSTSSGETFPFYKDLRDHQSSIRNFFHDHNHDRSSSIFTSLG